MFYVKEMNIRISIECYIYFVVFGKVISHQNPNAFLHFQNPKAFLYVEEHHIYLCNISVFNVIHW